MLSAVFTSQRSQPAMLLAEQLAHQRLVRPGPLVLRTALLKIPTRAADRGEEFFFFFVQHSGREHQQKLSWNVMIVEALGLLVSVSSTPFSASTSDLSTQSSTGGLTQKWESSS